MRNKGKILVTGGAGYIGSHTIIELLDAGYDVVSVDNFVNSSPKTFDRIKKITGVQVKNYNLDLCYTDKLIAVFKKEKNISGIIHFAALKSVPESVAEPVRYYGNNIGSLLSVLSVAEKFHVRKFVFSSSCSVYGDVTKLPVDESTPFGIPASPYATTKQMGEQMLLDFARTNKNFHSVALRYFNPAGAHTSGILGELPAGRPTSVVPNITQTAIGILKPPMKIFGDSYQTRDGSCIRDYVHVSDIARAHVLALAKMKSNFDIINLGTGRGVTVLELVRAFERANNIKLSYKITKPRPGDVPAVYASNKKAIKVLGWKAVYSLDEMLRSAWRWEYSLRNKK